MKNTSKKIKRRRNILSLITLLVTIVTIYFMFKIDIIPFKFFILILIGLIIILVLGIVLLNKDKKVFMIIGIILLLLSIVGDGVCIYHMNNINSFLDKSFKATNTQKIRYYVIALEKNHYKKKDISGEVGYYENSLNVDKALEKMTNHNKIEDLNFSEINTMFDKLNSEEIKFILLEKVNYNIITDLDENIKSEDYQIVEEFDVLKKITTTSNRTKDSFNIYVGGTDYVGLMDFNTIITVNMRTHKILLTSIPRDTYVDVYGYNYKNKLSFITEGIDVSKNSLADFFDIDIAYYVKIDSESVAKLIDKIGGIEYCSDKEYSGSANINKNGTNQVVSYHVKKGCQELNGYQAIAASRTRNAFVGRDRVRQKNMQNIMIAIFKKISTTDNLMNYEDILNSLADTYQTDIPRKLITKNIKDMINNGNKWEIATQYIDGDDTIGTVHRFDYIEDWLLIPNMETVKTSSKTIKEYLK